MEVGSSITIIEGNNAATEAHAIFCFSPPERENKLFPKRVDIFNSLTVFSKFEKIEGIEGLTLDEVESKFEDEPVIIQAIQYIRERDTDEGSYKNEEIEQENIEESDIVDKTTV